MQENYFPIVRSEFYYGFPFDLAVDAIKFYQMHSRNYCPYLSCAKVGKNGSNSEKRDSVYILATKGALSAIVWYYFFNL